MTTQYVKPPVELHLKTPMSLEEIIAKGLTPRRIDPAKSPEFGAQLTRYAFEVTHEIGVLLNMMEGVFDQLGKVAVMADTFSKQCLESSEEVQVAQPPPNTQ